MSTASDLTFDVAGMDCADCAMTVQRVVQATPGVTSATVNFAVGTLVVTPSADAIGDLPRSVAHNVDRAGYQAVLREGGKRVAAPTVAWYRSGAVIHAGIALILWLAATTVGQLTDARGLSITLYIAAIILGGYPIAKMAWQGVRVRRIDMNVLMTISVIGAALIGEWSEGALVVALFSIGNALQTVTMDRTRNSIRSLFELTPEEATVLQGGTEARVAVSNLAVGDVMRIRPGERVPADGEIVAGSSDFTESAITGESMPVEKTTGGTVFAGALNGSGLVDVRVTTLPQNSTIATIITLVEEAQSAKAPSQQLVDRFAALYTPIVVGLALAIALLGWAFGDGGEWFYRALVLLVIACPCALVISTPVSIVSAIGAATRQGILVKGGAALEEAGRIDTVAFDKTGTITLGRPMITEILPEPGIDPQRVLTLAAAIERGSEHPLARAIVAQGLRTQVAELPVADFRAITSAGAVGTVDGRQVGVGNARLLAELGIAEPDATSTTATPVYVAADGELLGTILIADQPRTGVAEVVRTLRAHGVKHVAMLTGDREAVAAHIAQSLQLDDIRAGLLPQGKTEAIASWQQQGKHVLLVGDGVNDAPALAHANVGVAMGMAGTDIALDSADVALMRDDLAAIPRVIALGQRTVSIIRQNISISLITKLIALVLGLFGFVSLWIAVVADVGTSLLVTLNGMRLARQPKRD